METMSSQAIKECAKAWNVCYPVKDAGSTGKSAAWSQTAHSGKCNMMERMRSPMLAKSWGQAGEAGVEREAHRRVSGYTDPCHTLMVDTGHSVLCTEFKWWTLGDEIRQCRVTHCTECTLGKERWPWNGWKCQKKGIIDLQHILLWLTPSKKRCIK